MSDQKRPTGRPKGKPLSPRELEQRREASKRGAEMATGPISTEGKAASSRNGWKHGRYSQAAEHRERLESLMVGAFGKPCRSSCPKHPSQEPQYPCSLVLDGLTKPGKDCLDKTVYLDAFEDLMTALRTQSADAMHVTMAAQVAGAIEVLQQLREQIAEKGVLVLKPFINKAGELIVDGDGKPVGDLVLNPAISQFTFLLDKLGFSLPELLATPRAAAKAGDGEDAGDALVDLLGSALSRANVRRVARSPEVTDGEFEER